MNALFTWIDANWFYTIGAVLSFFAAFGFLIFLRGFLLGLNQLLYIDGDAEYVDRARIRIVWGTIIILNVFVLWVFIRAIVALFGVGTVNAPLSMWILTAYALVIAALFIQKARKGGH